MVADALGKQGQSLASGVARQPGEGGQRLVEALNARQSGQASRVVNALDDAFKTGGKTADEATAAISQRIRATDKANFAKVPDEAVNPSTALRLIQEGTKSVKEGLKPTKIEKTLSRYGNMLKSSRSQAPVKYNASPSTGYRGEHRAPINDGYHKSLDDLSGVYGDDIYSANAKQYFSASKADNEAIDIMQKMRGKPNDEITVYRAVPKDAPDVFNKGDWVSITKDYANSHGQNQLNNSFKLISMKVKAKDIFTKGDSPSEWGLDITNHAVRSTPSTQRMITIRQDVADAADKAFRAGNGGLGTKLKELKAAIDDDILAVSPAYQQANAASSQLRGVREQIAAGQTAATRGRQEDIVNALRQQSPEQRAAFAIGFADKGIARAQGGAEGVNAARPLTSQRFGQISKELTEDGGEKLGRQIKRENDMFATRQRAAGGSMTANNLADQANVNAPVNFGVQIARGDIPGALGHVLRGGLNKITGQTQKSRDALADMLMKTSDDTIVREAARRIKAGEKLTEAQKKAMVPLLAGGVAVTSGSQ